MVFIPLTGNEVRLQVNLNENEDGYLFLGSIKPSTEIYFPGTSLTIWVQGCSIRCKGCWNQKFWSFKGGYPVKPQTIVDLALKENVDGITLLGGEPLDQSHQIRELMSLAKKNDLGLMLYTGYELKEIMADPIKKECFHLADIVVSGRYVDELRCTNLKWRGSTNQQVHVNNPKYRDINIQETIQEVELEFDENGTVSIYGYPDKEFEEVFFNDEINR